MKKIIITFLLLYSFSINISLSREILNYSILIEEDFDIAMFIYRHQNVPNSGEIFDYENYEFFSKTYKNSSGETTSFLQPAHLKVPHDRLSYQRTQYKIKNFEYAYNVTRSGLSILTFKVPVELDKYINEVIPFSISTLSKTAWYAGTFTLVQNENDLKQILNNNPETFCKIILHAKTVNKNIKEFKKNELPSLGKKC